MSSKVSRKWNHAPPSPPPSFVFKVRPSWLTTPGNSAKLLNSEDCHRSMLETSVKSVAKTWRTTDDIFNYGCRTSPYTHLVPCKLDIFTIGIRITLIDWAFHNEYQLEDICRDLSMGRALDM